MFVHIFQMLACHMGVYLGCGYRRVPEEFLDGVDGGTLVQHLCGKGVPEDMRADALRSG